MYFDVSQALSRKWRRLGLTDAPHKVLSMAMTMALAPAKLFEEALSLIKVQADLISDEYPNINHFMKYLHATWLPLAQKVSVYECPVRTNNITESFHNIITNKFIRAHANIWTFLGMLFNYMRDIYDAFSIVHL